MIYSFQQYQLDTLHKKLYLDSKPVTDDLKIVKLIEVLCQSYPEMVDKDYLMEALWPGQVVSEASLSRVVSDTRALLDDSGKQQELIKTIRGKGFRLNTQVSLQDNLNPNKADINPTDKSHAKYLLALIIILVSALGWLGFHRYDSGHSESDGIRIAVLPVESVTSEPIDEWIRFGIMSMATEQLGRYSAIQSIPVNKIISLIGSSVPQETSSENLSKADLLRRSFSDYCRQLGCTHLVVINFSLQNNQTALSYQFITQDNVSILKEFVENDVMEAADLMLDHLASDLIPQKRQRLSIQTSYSDNNKANRDYATGVHELYDGNYSAAEEYLRLALNKAPEFFWAKAYLAEAKYRQGQFKEASEIILELESRNAKAQLNEAKKAYFLGNLKSNILYSLGKLQESLDLSLKLLELSVVQEEPLATADLYLNIGSSYQALGSLQEAYRYLQKSEMYYEIAHFPSGKGKALFNLGNVYLTDSKYSDAIAIYQQARDVFVEYSMVGYALMAKHQIATTSVKLGKFQQAELELRVLVDEYAGIGDKEGELMALLDLAIVSSEKKDFTEAKARIEHLLGLLNGSQYDYLLNHSLTVAIRVHLMLQDVQSAKKLYAQVKGEWNDPRPAFALIPAHIQHDLGDLDGAVETATKIKERLGAAWNQKHQAILEQMLTSKENGNISQLMY